MTIATAQHTTTDRTDSWADLSGRWFFAWRMASACEDALREVHSALDDQNDPQRIEALEKVSGLLRSEMRRWVRRGEALDIIVERLHKQTA